jgi:hypothetical protein
MPLRAATPPLAQSRDGTVYLVLDSQADRKTIVADPLSGRYRRPLRVVAFNTAEGRARDVTAEILSLVRAGISVP